MGAYNVVNRAALASGQPEDISVVLANLDAIAAVLNGGLDNSNIDAAAAIAASKLAGYPADATKVLKGDGSWAAVASDGWNTASTTLAYSSTDGHTFVVTSTADLTATVPVGARIKLTHSAATKYFIVTAIAAGTITLYGGTDYTLSATAITSPSYSIVKAPFGFPIDPAKWTDTVTNTTSLTQSAPVVGTWYNPGSFSIPVPIGCWWLEWNGMMFVQGTNGDIYETLSTATNTESDSELTAYLSLSTTLQYASQARGKFLTVAAKTPYYLNTKTSTASMSAIGVRGDVVKTIIRATCAYL